MSQSIDELAEFVARELYIPDHIYERAVCVVRANPPGSVQRFRACRTIEILEACVLYGCRNANT